ncbi:MAG: glycosyltransferase family 4 protein [Chthoniobacterales bacterium]
MRVLAVVEQGNAPSIRLRVGDHIARYRDSGIEITLLPTHAKISDRLNVARQASRHDVVMLFKTIGFTPLQLALLRRTNPRIVFDFDDAVMFREQKYRQPVRARTFQKFVRTMKICAAVVAGNEFLAGFAEACDRRALVLPTPIDLSRYVVKPPVEGRGRTIGWLGLSDGLPYVRQIAPALRRLTETFPDLRLKIISDKPLELEGVRVENELWRAETEQAHLASFDVGIMPLWDSVWTRGKCGYKILQYMGVGTAVVASSVGVNRQIIRDGENGFLATSENDWFERIRRLLEQSDLRRQFAVRGRQLIEEHYSADQYVTKYAALLAKVARG